MIELDTIHHADCFDLMAQIDDASIDALITDMPYAVTALKWDRMIDLDLWWAAVKRILKPRGVFVTTASEPFASLLRVSNLEWYKYDWVWDKGNGSNPALVNSQPFKIHENICVFSQGTIFNAQYEEGDSYIRTSGTKPRDGLSSSFNKKVVTINLGNRNPRSIIRFSNAKQNGKQHPTQKPVALYEYLIRTYTQPGDLVLDPFCGSGTTALAAFRTGRHYICGDSDAGYIEIARQRLVAADPYQDKQIDETTTQLSLFSNT